MKIMIANIILRMSNGISILKRTRNSKVI